MITVKFEYFGYAIVFATSLPTVAERRAYANASVIAAFGEQPAMAYVEPGRPFPDYVPMQVWDRETGYFY